MDEDSATESESEWDPESSSSSDWSEDEGNRQQEKKRKVKTRSCNVSEQKGTKLVKKIGATSKSCENASQSLEELMENDSQLTVTCGDKEGSLDLEKFGKKENCIFSGGRWFQPSGFEKFGGKEKSKKWRSSILCCGVPLQKLIENKLISSPNFKKSRIQVEQSNGSPVTARLRGMKRNSSKSSRATPTSSCAAGSARETKSRKRLFPSTSESERKYNGHHEDKGNSNNEDEIDMTFQGPTLPVTCESLFGILHKSRFATGFCGKCIRTEDFWLTPEEFIRLSKQDGAWRKDIVTHGRPLGKLIMEKVLEPHAQNCECDVCLKLDQDTDDDLSRIQSLFKRKFETIFKPL